MNILYICDTPYQIFNVLNIVFNDFDLENGEKSAERDLYIINQFRSAGSLAKKIKKTNMFSKVYLLRKDDTKFLKVGTKRNIYMSIDFLFPKIFLRNRFKDYDFRTINYKKYDVVYASGAFSTVAAVLKLNTQARFCMYEDGLGSYSGNYIEISSGGRLNKKFCDLFHVGSYVCKPEKLLVNNVALCNSTSVPRNKIQKLPEFNEKFIELCNRIFDVSEDNDYLIYWLSQPLDSHQGAEETRNIIREKMYMYRDNLVVRMHPRDLDYHFYSGFRLDKGKDLWELTIAKRNANEMILIGTYSSAQVTPKVLFDMEPTLIFLHALNHTMSQEKISDINSKIEQLKELYRDQDKIYIPQNENELEVVLRSVIENGYNI